MTPTRFSRATAQHIRARLARASRLEVLEHRLLLCSMPKGGGASDCLSDDVSSSKETQPLVNPVKTSAGLKMKGAVHNPVAGPGLPLSYDPFEQPTAGPSGMPAGGPEATTVGPVINVSKLGSGQNESEAEIAINPANPSQIFVSSNIETGTGLMLSYSNDGGLTWTSRVGATGADITAACCDSVVEYDSFGNLYMAYLTSSIGIVIARSTNNGQTFTVIQSYAAASWDNLSIDVGANNMVAVEARGSSGIGYFYATSTGLGTTGAWAGPIYAPGSSGKNYGDVAVLNNGGIALTGTNSSGQNAATNPIWIDPDGPTGAAAFSLVKTVNTNVGGFDYIPAQSGRSVDSEPNFAVAPAGSPFAGRLYYCYLDEKVDENNDTDVKLIYTDDMGANWSAPLIVNDDAGSRSQFLQRIAVDPTTGYVALSWHDSRNDNGVLPNGTNAVANDDAQFWGAISKNGGVSFEPNFVIDPGWSNDNAAGNGIDYGDYTGIDFYAGHMFAAFSDNSTAPSPANTGLPQFDVVTANVSVDSVAIKGFSGIVYNDADASGTFGGSDTGLSGATVYIDADNSGTLTGGDPTQTTASGGLYTFTGLADGVYTARVVTPAGNRQTAPAAGFFTITVSNGTPFTSNQNFGVTSTVKITGAVYNDLNGNGSRQGGEPGLPGQTVYLDLNNNGTFDSVGGTFNSTDVPKTINDNATVTSNLPIVAAGNVTNLTVRINITHTFDADLDIFLISPSGTRVELSTDNGGSADNFVNTVFDDAAATSITTGVAPFTGNFRPETPLSAVNGQPITGTWRLEVTDDATTDVGSLTSWSITVGGSEPNNTSSASGDYTFDALPAGAYNVRAVPIGAPWILTQPGSGVYALNLSSGQVVGSNDFGFYDTTSDTIAPTVQSSAFSFDTSPSPMNVAIDFSENVQASLALDSTLRVRNTDTNTYVPAGNMTLSYGAGDVATIRFPGYALGALPAGNYELIATTGVMDPAGNPLAAQHTLGFFFINGDVTRNKSVNSSDFNVLATNFGTASGMVFSTGDCTFDGAVTSADFNVLATAFGTSIPGAGEAARGGTGSSGGTFNSGSTIGDDDDGGIGGILA